MNSDLSFGKFPFEDSKEAIEIEKYKNELFIKKIHPDDIPYFVKLKFDKGIEILFDENTKCIRWFDNSFTFYKTIKEFLKIFDNINQYKNPIVTIFITPENDQERNDIENQLKKLHYKVNWKEYPRLHIPPIEKQHCQCIIA